jgi:ribosome-associated heat shock protein Hsp15
LGLDRQRIDKWLWHARVVRTRSAAAALADDGKVRVNGTRIDAASRPVKAGDVVTIALDRIRIIKVCDFSERRGSAVDAQALYELIDDGRVEPAARPEPGPGEGESRPDKRARRDILRLKRGGND